MTDNLRKNSLPYPTEVGSQRFEPVPVENQRDLQINQARAAARSEHDRIMEIAQVLKTQLEAVHRRLDVLEQVAQAHCAFVPVRNRNYWLLYNHRKQRYELSMMGPDHWSCGAPDHHEYVAEVTHAADGSWDMVT